MARPTGCAASSPAQIEVDLPVGVPIIWMPGVSKSDIRSVEECPVLLQPLLELQFRGTLWTQRNGKDWTSYAFLVSKDTLGIEVTGDDATRTALSQSLHLLANEPIRRLRREAPLRAAFFQELLNPDPPRAVLRWLDDPAGQKETQSAEAWSAFQSLCQRQYRFDPERDGPLTAAAHLGKRHGQWRVVWQRYAEAPNVYPNVPDQLRAARPQNPVSMFAESIEETWPQDNDEAENRLRIALNELANVTPGQARKRVFELESEHGARRNWVWARLGQAPLATALEHLATLTRTTEHSLAGATVKDIAETWTGSGWQADDAALRAMAAVERADDSNAVGKAVVALYRRWLEQAALTFQEAMHQHPKEWQRAVPVTAEAGTCSALQRRAAFRCRPTTRRSAAVTRSGRFPQLAIHAASRCDPDREAGHFPGR